LTFAGALCARSTRRNAYGDPVHRQEGIVWLTDGVVAPVLWFDRDALLVVGGPSGAGKSTLAARVLEGVIDADEVRAAMAAERGVAIADIDWGEALARTREVYAERLSRGQGATLVTTAVRRGHRIGLAKDAEAAGVPCHLLMLDASLDLCVAGRAAQGDPRISDGLFLHLVREWQAFRRELVTGTLPDGIASVTVLDRTAADALERIDLLAAAPPR
jgi:predicted kinase